LTHNTLFRGGCAFDKKILPTITSLIEEYFKLGEGDGYAHADGERSDNVSRGEAKRDEVRLSPRLGRASISENRLSYVKRG